MHRASTSTLPPRRRLGAFGCSLSLVASLLAVPTLTVIAPRNADAAPPTIGGPTAADRARAQALFYEARALMQQKRMLEACAKLEESLHLERGLGIEFNLADCNEKVGKTATAWAGFMSVAAGAKEKNQAEREKLARERAKALEPKLPKLVIDVPVVPEGLEITRDGAPVTSASWGAAVPVDPGEHRVVATAPGREAWATSTRASEGSIARVSVPRELPLASKGAVVAIPVAPAPAAAAEEAAPPRPTTTFPPPASHHGSSAQKTVGYAIAALGVASLAVGGGFGLTSLSKRNEAKDHCNGDACDASGVDLRDDAIKAGNVATITSIAGGVALLGGILLVATSPTSPSGERESGAATKPAVATNDPTRRGPSVRATPTLGPSGGGLFLQGAF